MQALKDGDKVALTINTDRMPHKVLLIRGTVRTDTVDEIAQEYAAMTRRVMGDQAGQAWLDQIAPMSPRMARIFVHPEWVGIIDFETRFPSAIERAMEHAGVGA